MAPCTNAVFAILELLVVNGTMSGVVPATSICKLSTIIVSDDIEFADTLFNPFMLLLFAPVLDDDILYYNYILFLLNYNYNIKLLNYYI
jgi:hypothetical protein